MLSASVHRLLLSLLLCWLLLEPAQAQDTLPNEFRFEHLTVDQGLSHSDAMAVAQDRAGFIWVGTNRGLDRYDGYTLKPYSLPVTSTGVSGNRIKTLLVARNGRLWVGTERAGLSYYDAATDRFLTFGEQRAPPAARPLVRQLASASIRALATDAQGRLWVGTQLAGLFMLAFDGQGQLAAISRVPLLANPSAS